MEEVPKHIVLARAIQTINNGETTPEWKQQHIAIILYIKDGFSDPSLINPDIVEPLFREGVRRIHILSKYLGTELRTTNTFDIEVFKILCAEILDCLDLTTDDEWLCESMQSVTI